MNRNSTIAPLLGFIVIGSILSIFCVLTQAQGPEKPKPDELPYAWAEFVDVSNCSIQAGDSELRKLQKERLRAAVTEFETGIEQSKGMITRLDFAGIGRRIVTARLALAVNAAEQIKIQTLYVMYARDTERFQQARFDAGAIKQYDLELAIYNRLDAEIQLVLLGASLPEQAKKTGEKKDRAAKPPDQAKPPERVNLEPFGLDAADTELRRIIKRRANCANTEYTLRRTRYFDGRGDFSELIDAAKRDRDSKLELMGAASRVNVLKQYLQFHQELEKYHNKIWENATVIEHFVAQTFFERLSAQIDVLLISNPRPLAPIQLPDVEPDLDRFDDLFSMPMYALAKPFASAKSYAIESSEPEIQRLLKERMNWAIVDVRGNFQEVCKGRSTLDSLMASARRARDVRCELSAHAALRTEVRKQYLDMLRNTESLVKARVDHGAVRSEHLERCRFERLTAEMELMQAKSK